MTFGDSSPRRILLIDSDVGASAVLTETLRWDKHFVVCVKTVEQAKEALPQVQPDLVLMDFDHLDFNAGLDLLTQIRQQPRYTAVIFMSNRASSQNIVQGLDVGADDFITKAFEPLELLARVRRQLRSKDIYDQLAEANEKLQALVEIDDLTGLHNMRSVYERIEAELQRASRFQRSVCVVMMDMDHFKKVNDGHDHLFGSYVISEVGRLIQSSIRSIDLGARYGGDEFLVMLTETNLEGAEQFCNRLREKIQNTHFKNGPDEIKLTLSLGFAITSPGDSSIDARSLVRAADHALYEAKRQGRNQVTHVLIHQHDAAQESRWIKSRHAEAPGLPAKIKKAG